MNTERLNSWLTLLANIGVLIGLVVLIIEIRHSTDVAQAQMADAAIAGHNELNMAAFTSPQTSRVVVLGFFDPSKLTDAEAAQFQFWLRAKVNQDLRIWRMRQLGFSSAEDRENELRQLAGMLSTPGGKLFLEDNRAGFPELLFRELEPYLGTEIDLGQTLGRDPSIME